VPPMVTGSAACPKRFFLVVGRVVMLC